MTGVLLLALAVFLEIPIKGTLGESRTNFKLTRFELCGLDPSVNFTAKIVTEKDGQYLSYDLMTPYPIDQNIGVTCLIETLLTDKTSVPLFTVRENYLCMAANKFLGEFWYDILRGSQVAKQCPIPAGRYHARHVYLNFKAITLQTFPFGKLRFTFNIVNNRKPKNNFVCFLCEAENIPN